MNIRKTQSLFAVFTLVAMLLGGCTKELPPSEGDSTLTGEEVEVALTLAPEVLKSPISPSAAMAKAAGARNSGSIIAEMVDEPASRAVDDAAVNNVWVFQFNGSGDNALLVRKTYYYSTTSASTFTLRVGTNQRIVVLANSSDPALGSALTSTSTYAALKALVRPIEKGMGSAVPMSGELVTNITASTPLTISLSRIFAKVTLRVRLATGMVTTDWSAQAMDVAPTYWLPEANGDFPASDKLIVNSSYAPQPNLTLSTTDFTEFTWYLPINRRGEVAGTSALDRRTNAPTGSTYIKLSCISTGGDIYFIAFYYIHLGANQTSDYNLRGNTQYTIKATLFPDAGNDSRVDSKELDLTDLQYAGMFGGELKERDGVWQFSKELWVQKTDASTNTPWETNSTEVVTNINDKVDGKGNTLALVKLGERYAAAKLCFDKNTGLTASTATLSNPAYQWYLPSSNQLMGVWTAHNSFSNAFASTSYWSSTEGSNNTSWSYNFNLGYPSNTSKTYTSCRTRCVREWEL